MREHIILSDIHLNITIHASIESMENEFREMDEVNWYGL